MNYMSPGVADLSLASSKAQQLTPPNSQLRRKLGRQPSYPTHSYQTPNLHFYLCLYRHGSRPWRPGKSFSLLHLILCHGRPCQ